MRKQEKEKGKLEEEPWRESVFRDKPQGRESLRLKGHFNTRENRGRDIESRIAQILRSRETAKESMERIGENNQMGTESLRAKINEGQNKLGQKRQKEKERERALGGWQYVFQMARYW